MKKKKIIKKMEKKIKKDSYPKGTKKGKKWFDTNHIEKSLKQSIFHLKFDENEVILKMLLKKIQKN